MSNSIQTVERNHFIDFLRGIAIFFMFWGHCIQLTIPSGNDFFENTVFKFIYSFHMPLFMMLSGYLFGLKLKKTPNNDIPNLIGKRTITILTSFIIGSIFIVF